jgi:AAA+ ATPase superfamily predicted ATPase
MKFINREMEIKALEKFWKQKETQLIVIYGKRRVGKTELIKHFIKQKPYIYFLAQKLSEHENLKILGERIGEFFKDDILKKNGFENWKWFFEYLKKNLKNKIVLVFDEFPYLAEVNKGISSVFQAGFDEYLKELPIFIIMCGSSIAMMESEVLSYKAPLYGRRTGQIFLKPFTFFDAIKFFPKVNFTNLVELYSITGGNPSYLKRLDARFSLDRNIKENIIEPAAFLYNEVEFILREELREPRNYFAILKAIALSKNKVSEIVNETSLEKSILHKYLFVLEDLHIIKKEVPITEEKPLKSRRGIYKLQDEFFKFWFRYILPNKGYIEEGKFDFVLKKIKETFNLLVAENYENIAMEILKNKQSKFFPITKIGRWWDRNEEIDIIALNEEERKIIFGEVKWSNKPIGTNIYEELKRKSQQVDWNKNKRNEFFALFSKSGFTFDMKKLAKQEKVALFHKDFLI